MPNPADSPFIHRGVVEGYYGAAASDADRRWLIERMAAWGMNVYLHAPKDDRYGRDDWREPYPAARIAEFASLVEHGDRLGVRVGFALSPGLSMRYSDTSDIDRLLAKFAKFADIGARFFSLALDDVPTALAHSVDREAFATLGDAHVAVTRRVRESLPDDSTLWLVPTDYIGDTASTYLATLAEGLPLDVEIGWTGRTVLSPTITPDEAARRAAQLGRRLLVWDNTPVNDGPMRTLLHLSPYVGRDAGIAESLSGILLNPMESIRASQITLRCAADYMADPVGYDAEASWQRATLEAGEGAAEAFTCFARAHRFSPLSPDDRDAPLEAAFETLRIEFERDGATVGDRERATAHLAELVAARTDAAATVRVNLSDTALRDEIEPWLSAHAAESALLSAVCDFLATLARGERGMPLVLAFSRMQGRITRLPASRNVSFGPRRALYPQLADLGDDTARFERDPVLIRDRCLAEEILRFAESEALAVLQPEP